MNTPGLSVVVTAGTGHGVTELAAFDAALRAAGVADLNLIRLTSIIPPGSTVHTPPDGHILPGHRGDRLYAVYAEHRQSVPGRCGCAGLGWAQDDTGAGLLVEHYGDEQAQVEAYLDATLTDMKLRRPGRYSANHCRTTSIECHGPPVAAVVIAAFHVQRW